MRLIIKCLRCALVQDFTYKITGYEAARTKLQEALSGEEDSKKKGGKGKKGKKK